MALAKRSSNSTRLVIILVVVIVVAGVGYLLFREFFLKPGEEADNLNAAARRKSVLTNFGDSILQDPRYQALKSYEVPVQVDVNAEGGQSNPFH